MPNPVNVEVRTVELDDLASGGNSCKFYRVYIVGAFTVYQYGSMRNGASGGSYTATRHPNNASASVKAAAQLHTKTSKGYVETAKHTFSVDYDQFSAQYGSDPKIAGIWLENQFKAWLRQQPRQSPPPRQANTTPPPKPAPKPAAVPESKSADQITALTVAVDSIDNFGKEALTLMAIATTDPSKAAGRLAALRTQYDAITTATMKFGSYLETLDMIIEEAL